MKSIFNFIKTSIKGGIFLFLPLYFIFHLLKEGHEILEKITKPFISHFKIDVLLGEFGTKLLVLFMLILLFFIGGLLMRIPIFKAFNQKVEDFITILFPQYAKLKNELDEKMENIKNDPANRDHYKLKD